MKSVLFTSLFVVGVLSTFTFGAWIVGGMLYVFDQSASHPGLIAYTPKWIFLFSPFILLWKKEEVQEMVEEVIFLLRKKEISLHDISLKEIETLCNRHKMIAVVDGDSMKVTFKKGGGDENYHPAP
ncbi:MAG: hypothetical protein K9M12_00615 [Candidatus Pacebacteria bacterium]|nr:hypothetical protein [Candidatus Paceibacterota bacterium]